MIDESFVENYLARFTSIIENGRLTEQLTAAREKLEGVRDREAKVMFAGNGASASIASHYALDFTKQAGIRSIAFNDGPLLTAYGNDYGYDQWVARAMDHHGKSEDIAVLISTSGSSPNMVNAAELCRQRGIDVITYTGFEATNPLKARGDVNFWADSQAYNLIEAVHALWLGLLCDLVIGKMEYSVSE